MSRTNYATGFPIAVWRRHSLFEPSPLIVGAANRRSARLLSILQFAHVWVYLGTATVMRLGETGVLHRVGPVILGSAAAGALGSYALSRTRHATLAAWLFILQSLAIGPALLQFCPIEPGIAFIRIAFLLITVSLTNILASARSTLVCAALALISMTWALRASSSPPPWSELRPAIVFFLSSVTLILVLAFHRDGIEADRSAELRARNAELENLRDTLEQRISARTVELSARNAAMRVVLDNVAQGLFAVDRSGVISSNQSAALTNWFGPVTPGQPFYDYFGRCSAAFGKRQEFAWQQVQDDVLPLELALAQMPDLFVFEGRSFRISFQVIGSDSERFLVVVSDVTAELERAAMQQEKQELMGIFEAMLDDRSAFLAFVDEGTHLVAQILAATTDRVVLARSVHTLKGNTMCFGIVSVSTLCHEIESQLTEPDASITATSLARLADRWAQVTAKVDRLLGDRRHVIEISPQQYAELEHAVRHGQPHADLLNRVQELKLEPVERRLKQFAQQARQIATRLGKETQVEISHDGLRLARRKWAPFWAAFVHAVRNAVDHGVEHPLERSALGKPKRGGLALRALSDGETFRIELEDDGRGIDWEAIRRRCLGKGLRERTHEDLVAALLVGGVSTASDVTDISGRGLGMGALHSAVVNLGGQLEVQSTLGFGTRVQMVFPKSAALS